LVVADRYRVPKNRAQIQVEFTPGTSETFFLFLAEFSERRRGPERAEDVLNGNLDFVAVQNDRGETSFLRCSSVAIVTLGKEGELVDGTAGADPLAADFDIEVPVALLLDDGTRLEGVTRYQLPEANARINDFLNGSEPFMALFHDGRISLVNKLRIRRVELR
jgi:hypothetical protein